MAGARNSRHNESLPLQYGSSSKKPPHPARLRLAALSPRGRGQAVPAERLYLASAGSSAFPKSERSSFATKASDLVEGGFACVAEVYPSTFAVCPLPSRERADAEGGRVRGLFHRFIIAETGDERTIPTNRLTLFCHRPCSRRGLSIRRERREQSAVLPGRATAIGARIQQCQRNARDESAMARLRCHANKKLANARPPCPTQTHRNLQSRPTGTSERAHRC